MNFNFLYFGNQPKRYVGMCVTDRERENKAVNEGFEYLRTDPKDNTSLYRKPDRTATVSIGQD